jgi:hypothetical protein
MKAWQEERLNLPYERFMKRYKERELLDLSCEELSRKGLAKSLTSYKYNNRIGMWLEER